MSDPISIANHWFEACNEHDLERILSLYHQDARHYSPKLKVRRPETGGMIAGKDALRAWWTDVFGRLPSLKLHPVALTSNGERVFMEYDRQADGEPDMQVAEVLEIKNGLIAESRVFHG
jgi:predicted SnoaL-like aldol condensation-catalyzing enzyme